MIITPLDLEAWAGRSPARSELPVLLRKLVHARPVSLRSVSFPAYESVNEGGWDGEVEGEGVDPWIPEGVSFWEMSCKAARDLAGKARSDFDKRTASTDPTVRAVSEFVFVTPRKWSGKAGWLRRHGSIGGWRGVRVYDADTLSEWIETSPAALAFLSGQIGRSTTDLCSLEAFWSEWADVTTPRLLPELFAEALEENGAYLSAFMAEAPQSPLTIAGETRLEAAAFATSALLHGALADPHGHRGVVVRTAAGIQALKAHPAPGVVIVATADAELVMGDLASRAHVLIPMDRAGEDRNREPTIEPLTWDAFRAAAEAMGLDEDARSRLEADSGRRITLLRRQLAHVPAIRTPVWVTDPAAAAAMAPLALAGGWNFRREADQTFLAALADQSVEAVEAAIANLSALPDAPVFSVAGVGGVVSRADAFTALRGRITRGQLRSWFGHLRTLLSEADPALDLEPEQRWAANVYGKERLHSAGLRRQAAETLTFLAVHGGRTLATDFDCAAAASSLVRDLLAEGDDAWFHLSDVLQPLAEAAPDAFLTAVEKDLPHEAEDRGVWRLIKPAGSGAFGDNPRTTLLWALERLAWDPARYPRVAGVLARLSQRPLADNWINKPVRSLYSTLHPWLAQTAAPITLRQQVLTRLHVAVPDVAWALSLDLIDQRLSHGEYSQRPRYRAEAIGHGHQPNDADRAILTTAGDSLLGRASYTTAQIGELVEKEPCFPDDRLEALWAVIRNWEFDAVSADVALIRERIRLNALGRFARRTGPRRDLAREVYDALQPTDLLHVNAWMFSAGWLDWGADELDAEDVETSHAVREARIAADRRAALQEIWHARGLDGVLDFAAVVGEPWLIGRLAVQSIAGFDPFEAVEAAFITRPLEPSVRRSFAGGVFSTEAAGEGGSLLRALLTKWNHAAEPGLDLLLASPFGLGTWTVVDALPPNLREAYWREASGLSRDGAATTERATRELLAAGRPLSALHQLYFDTTEMPTDLLTAVLTAVATGPSEDGVTLAAHQVEACFTALDAREDCPFPELVKLEFYYCHGLERSKRGLKALSRALADEPELFVEAVKAVYRDTRTPRDPDAELTGLAKQHYDHWRSVLEYVAYGPGGDADGGLDADRFEAWMATVTPLLEDCGRLESGLHVIGKILGRTRIEKDGVWPPSSFAPALERRADGSLTEGLYFGIINSRGVQWRDRGGRQERALADHYRTWAEACAVDCPRLAACFEGIARSFEYDAAWQDDRARLERAAPQ